MGNNYSLMWIEKSKTDEKFLEYSYQYQKKYPFIWNYLVKKIIIVIIIDKILSNIA